MRDVDSFSLFCLHRSNKHLPNQSNRSHVQRRQFLQTSGLTLVSTMSIAGCLSSSSDSNTETVDSGMSDDAESDDSSYDNSDSSDYDAEATTERALEAPPRESEVFAAIEATSDELQITFESNPVVQSRNTVKSTPTATTKEAGTTIPTTTNSANGTGTPTAVATSNMSVTATPATQTSTDATDRSFSLWSLVPVGTASARSPGRGGRSGSGRSGGSGGKKSGGGSSGKSGSGKKGSGSSGKSGSGSSSGGTRPSAGKRGSGKSSFRGRNGRYKWHGGHYSLWHDRHDDEVHEYDANVTQCGVGYLGSETDDEYDLPEAGAVEWDHDCDGDHTEMTVTPDETGWYRVGARLGATADDHDFGWEAVDLKLVEHDGELEIDSQWKISPRL